MSTCVQHDCVQQVGAYVQELRQCVRRFFSGCPYRAWVLGKSWSKGRLRTLDDFTTVLVDALGGPFFRGGSKSTVENI